MSTLLIGNLSHLTSVSLFSSKLNYMVDCVYTAINESDMVLGEPKGQKSGLSDLFGNVGEKIGNAAQHVSPCVFVPSVEHLFTFRMGSKIFTIVPNPEELANGRFDLGQQLKKLDLADFQKVNLLVELEAVSLSERLNSMKTDVFTIKGSDVRFRAKHIIKPAQPGQEHLNAWSNLTDVVSIVVTRLPENPEVRVQAELAYLKDVIESSNLFEVDKDENILIKL